MCTLQQLEEYYSIDDLADFNEAITVEYLYIKHSSAASEKKNVIVIDGGVKNGSGN